jgi:integrase
VSVFQNQQRGGVWSFDFVLAGKRYRGACVDRQTGRRAANRTEARQLEIVEKAAARQAQALDRSAARGDSYTIAQAAAAWLSRKAGRTASHVDNVRLYVAEILAFFGPATPIGEIRDDQVEAYRRHATAQPLRVWAGGRGKRPAADRPDLWRSTDRIRSARTTNNYLKALRAIFALAERVRDPITRAPILDRAIEVRLHKVARRMPAPMADAELAARLATAPPWTIEAAELARLFGLRQREALQLQRRHIDSDARCIRFAAGDTKSGNQERAFGGGAGWQLLRRLDRQAQARGQAHLVTWPGPSHWRAFLAGEAVPTSSWRPLASIRRSWRTTAAAAGIEAPARFHDVRARYITEVAKVSQAAAKDAARHQDAATTDLYIRLADSEIRDAVAAAVDRRPSTRRSARS